MVSNLRALVAATALAAALAACGVTAPSGSVSWNQLKLATTCEALNPRFCAGAYGFAVQNDGHFTVGPAPDGTTSAGSIAASERAQLDQDLAAVIPSLGAATQCDAGTAVAGISETLELQLSDGSSAAVVASQGPGTKCYRGGRDAAVRLDSDFRTIMTRHYPLPFPQ